jgi:hypothetical protein
VPRGTARWSFTLVEDHRVRDHRARDHRARDHRARDHRARDHVRILESSGGTGSSIQGHLGGIPAGILAIRMTL